MAKAPSGPAPSSDRVRRELSSGSRPRRARQLQDSQSSAHAGAARAAVSRDEIAAVPRANAAAAQNAAG